VIVGLISILATYGIKVMTAVARASVLFLVAGLVVPVVRAQGPAHDVPAFALDLPKVRSKPPVFQFNGNDLTGFYTYLHEHKYEDPDRVFTVENRMIRISGNGFGGLTTRDEFENYHLIAEWKWGERTWGSREHNARDSGILLHCVGPDGAAGGNWMESIECQVIEGGCGDFIVVGGRGKPSLTCETRTGTDRQLYFEKGGTPTKRESGRFNWWGRDPHWKDTRGFRGSRDVEKPLGQWNRMEVVCDGDSITNIVNGHVVNVGQRSSLTKGKIQLQTEGAEIFFRMFEVRPLLK
jgi:Domain of Unknown Function (DUF1080)